MNLLIAGRFDEKLQNGSKMKILIFQKGKSGVLAWNMQCWKVNTNLNFYQNWVEQNCWKMLNIFGPTYWFNKFGEVGMKEQKVLQNWKNLLTNICLHLCFRVKEIFSIFKNFLLFHANLTKFMESSCLTKNMMFFFNKKNILLNFGRNLNFFHIQTLHV